MPETLREKAKNHPHIVNRVLALGLIASLLVIIVLTIFVQQQQYQMNQSATQIAGVNATVARESEINRSIALASQAQFLADKGDSSLALSLVLEAVKMENPPPEVESLLREILSVPGIAHVVPVSAPVNLTAYSLYGEPMPTVDVSSDGSFAIYASQNQLTMIDTQTGSVAWQLDTDGSFPELHPYITPDNRHMVVSGSTCAVYDLVSGGILTHTLAPSPCVPYFAPDGQTAYIVPDLIGSTCNLYDTATWQISYAVVCGSALFSPDSQVLVTVSNCLHCSLVTLTDVVTGSSLRSFELDMTMPRLLKLGNWSFSRGEQGGWMMGDTVEFITGNGTGLSVTMDGSTRIPYTLMQDSSHIFSGELRPDGRLILLDQDSRLYINNPNTPSSVVQVGRNVTILAQNEDAIWLVSDYGLVEVNLHTASESVSLPEPDILKVDYQGFGADMLLFSPYPTEVMLSDLSGVMSIFRLSDGALMGSIDNIRTSPVPATPVHSLDMHYYAAILNDGRVMIINRHDYPGKIPSPVLPAPPDAITFTPDSTQLLAVSASMRQIWRLDAATGALVETLPLPGDATWSDAIPGDPAHISYSPDGQHVLLWNLNSDILVMDASLKTLEFSHPHLEDYTLAVVFTADSQSIQAVAMDGTLETIALTSAGTTAHATLGKGEYSVMAVELRPEQHRLAVQNRSTVRLLRDDGTVLDTWKINYSPSEPIYQPYDVALSPDGNDVIVARPGRLEIWHYYALSELIDYARANRYIPEFTCQQREQYRIEPLCAVIPTDTPTVSYPRKMYLTPTPTPEMSPTPPA